MRLRPPISTLFPYTTLFRSTRVAEEDNKIATALARRVPRRGLPGADGARNPLGLLDGERGGGSGASRPRTLADRKSTRLNSSHLGISYAVFCLKKKNNNRRLALASEHVNVRHNREEVAVLQSLDVAGTPVAVDTVAS